MATTTITHYFDYKSPYAYLAQAETFQLESEFDVIVDFLPLTLDIPNFWVLPRSMTLAKS